MTLDELKSTPFQILEIKLFQMIYYKDFATGATNFFL